jgi:hypothetical protein
VSKPTAGQVSLALKNAAPVAPPAPLDRAPFLSAISEVTKVVFKPSDIDDMSDDAVLALDELLPQIIKSTFDRQALTSWIGPYGEMTRSKTTDEVLDVKRYQRLNEGVPLTFTICAVRGLTNYADYGYDEKETQALVDVTYVITKSMQRDPSSDLRKAVDLIDYEDHVYWIADRALAELIASRLDSTDAIISIVAKRDTADAELIRSLLDSGVSDALMEGAL